MQAIPLTHPDTVTTNTGQSHGRSAASWGAIFAGAVVAIGASLILLSLGAGFEFASVSPWTDRGVSSTTFSVTTAIWLIVTQWVSACLGGYITGRLRTRWIGTHTHEIFFRDTAHGLATWCVATVVVAAIAAASASSAVSGGVRAVSQVAGGGMMGMAAGANSPDESYGIDKLFRASGDAPVTVTPDVRAEAVHIFGNALTTDGVPDSDRTYLAALIAQKTGTSPEVAQARVNEFVASINDAKTRAKAAADAARKTAAETSLYTALALLVGAFIASVSAALAGRLRDEHI